MRRVGLGDIDDLYDGLVLIVIHVERMAKRQWRGKVVMKVIVRMVKCSQHPQKIVFVTDVRLLVRPPSGRRQISSGDSVRHNNGHIPHRAYPCAFRARTTAAAGATVVWGVNCKRRDRHGLARGTAETRISNGNFSLQTRQRQQAQARAYRVREKYMDWREGFIPGT